MAEGSGENPTQMEGGSGGENEQSGACCESDGEPQQQELSAVPEMSDLKAGTKLNSVKKKYERMVRLLKQSQQETAEYKKKLQELSRERDSVQTELSRANLAKSKLESLCRELQRHCKAVKEESLIRAKEDEGRRQDVSAKFQATINDVTLKMQECYSRNQQLKQENTELATKLKSLVEQYELRETHYEKLKRQHQLEVQIAEAKLAQHLAAAGEERETNLKEKHALLADAVHHQKRCEQLAQQEIELRGQLSLYTEKFEEFQKTLTKSNDVFGTFKKEMDKMTKTIKKLEKETNMWRARWETSNLSLSKMTDERSSQDKTIQALKAKTSKLESLCRAMQSERNELRDQLKQQQGVAATSEGNKQAEHVDHPEMSGGPQHSDVRECCDHLKQSEARELTQAPEHGNTSEHSNAPDHSDIHDLSDTHDLSDNTHDHDCNDASGHSDPCTNNNHLACLDCPKDSNRVEYSDHSNCGDHVDQSPEPPPSTPATSPSPERDIETSVVPHDDVEASSFGTSHSSLEHVA
ncbi:alpha-taxilin-like isoform X2 [Corticium candelabrum]|uniref:alpha-taxilin-like isoform X2 n=1 Tax=Corticium candelabrum TaxID=121492 RepID=UPI002E25CC3F|nr:alpha-taxilin-like isoform X2 [Corticium candelabrum]